ncbi:ABC-type transporter, integral membrane subunit [Gemmatirosa kalamazoonensis]|uniref:Autoinducer 2 import system permease protein LsrD n=1 Tax=Gemmatirosa kalamazoonensis TaxID=861299 RepID=W0RC47_9BACT|nr:ABC transporter permease [Gemmatirosa kalamazoonensis]AHG87890.1 ABC-type transporter, integral membrane subunit [Gemmatirosa kalamazoonensis]
MEATASPTTDLPLFRRVSGTLLRSQQLGLVIVLIILGAALTAAAGSHPDRVTGAQVNNFLNAYTLIQMATDASAFAIMGVGATIVIISGGIDLSVGAIYALAGVVMAMVLRAAGPMGPIATVLLGLGACLGVSLVCGLLNGLMVIGLGVHPFIITLGTMWMLRGIAFVISKAESILVPSALTDVVKASLGFRTALYPVPLLVTLLVTVIGSVYLVRTVMGRHVFAIGGNVEASRFSGLGVDRVKLGVYVISGISAGIAAFVGAAFYGSATSSDGTGYELYVIAAAVVGGASLAGGKGSAVSALLGALLIVTIRQAIRTLHLDQNYEWIIIGGALIIAVVLDQSGSRLLARRLAAASATANRPRAA